MPNRCVEAEQRQNLYLLPRRLLQLHGVRFHLSYGCCDSQRESPEEIRLPAKVGTNKGSSHEQQ